MFNTFPDARWYFYDNTSGQIILKHPYHPDLAIPCPHCGQRLQIQNYRASCCDGEFKTSFGEIRQCRPVATHSHTTGRGWDSLRPLEPTTNLWNST
jgi:hypothetical protein